MMPSPKPDHTKAIDQLFKLLQDVMVRLDRLEQAQAEMPVREREATPMPKRGGMFK